jgi:hypothetical protein
MKNQTTTKENEMEKYTIPTDEQLKVRPYYAEIVEHWNENYEPTRNTYHVSSDEHVLFDLECETFDHAEKLAELLNDVQAMFNPKGK